MKHRIVQHTINGGKKVKLTATTGILLIAVIVLAAMSFGILANPFAPGTTVTPTPPPGTTPTPPPGTVINTATAKWKISDALTQTATEAGDAAYVCTTRANQGKFNFLNPVEETEFDASPDTSSSYYTTGDELIIVVTSDNDPTSGDETYSRWFYIKYLDNGVPIKAFPTDNPKSALSGSVGAYSVNEGMLVDTGMFVRWIADENKSWIFGDYFAVYGRIDNTKITQQISYNGIVGTQVTDGATWDDSSTEVNANQTLTADEVDFKFEVIGAASDVCWGLPQLVLTASGEVKQYVAVLVFGTEATTMPASPLYADGWKAINIVGLTGNVSYYYPIVPSRDGCIPTSVGDVFSISVPISISDSGLTASTEYDYCGWMLDWQLEEDVARGAYVTAVPTARGFLADFGCDTVIQATAPTVSSSILATPQLYGYFTTNA
jgi:hypothetical protein